MGSATTTGHQVAAAETYLDVEKLLHNVVWKFQRRYGGCHEELMAEANYCFMERYRNADPVYGAKWTTWLTRKLWYALLDYMNRKMRYCAKFPKGSQKDNEYSLQHLKSRESFDKDGFLDELSEDARLVATLALEPPPDVLINSQEGYKTENGCKIEMALIEFLRDLGWATKRIFESFEEIRKALS